LKWIVKLFLVSLGVFLGVGTRMSDDALVSIVVLNYNGRDVLLKCLRSLYESDYTRFEVIVVDNGSTDGSVEAVRRDFPEAILIENRRNLGYGAGNNVGIKASRGEYIVLMNNDVFVVRDWLKALLEACVKHKSAGFFQPKILLESDKRVINSAGNMIHVAGFGLCRGIGEFDRGQYDEEIEIGFVSGACVLFRREVLGDVGFLDPVFFAFNEDTDWGWRALLYCWRSLYVPSAFVYHQLGYSWGRGLTAEKFYYLERNRVLMLLKNYSRRSLAILLPLLGFIEFCVLAYALVKGWFGSKIRSYLGVLGLKEYLHEQRNLLQRRRRLSDERVFAFFTAEVPRGYFGGMTSGINRIVSFFCNSILKTGGLKRDKGR